jgi:hypothetical protein
MRGTNIMDIELFKDIEHYSENIIRDIKIDYPSATEVYAKEKGVKRSEYWKDVGALFTNNSARMLEELNRKEQKMDRANESSLLFISLLKKNLFVANRKNIARNASIIFAWRTSLYWFFHRILQGDDSNIPDDYFRFLENNDYLGDYLAFTKKHEPKILQDASQIFCSLQGNSLASNYDYKQALEFTSKFYQFEKELFDFFSTRIL